MDDTDREILDETAEAATYLYTALIKQQHSIPGATGRAFSNETAAQLTAAAMPAILQGRLNIPRWGR